jgi:hypothetical protein
MFVGDGEGHGRTYTQLLDLAPRSGVGMPQLFHDNQSPPLEVTSDMQTMTSIQHNAGAEH